MRSLRPNTRHGNTISACWIDNKTLAASLTLKQEIDRLQKVITEKDAAIAAFKEYDEERKAYYQAIVTNYDHMEEQYKTMQGMFKAFEKDLRVLRGTGQIALSDYKDFITLYKFWKRQKIQFQDYQVKIQKIMPAIEKFRQVLEVLRVMITNKSNVKNEVHQLEAIQQRMSDILQRTYYPDSG